MSTEAVAGPGPRIAGIPAVRYTERLEAARARLGDGTGDALLVGVGADLRWLAGYDAMPLERLTMLVLTRDGDPTMVVPRLEATPALRSPAVASRGIEIETWEETDDPVALVHSLLRRAGVPPDGGGARLLVSDRLWAAFVLRLQARLPEARFGLASDVLRRLRMVKDADEIDLLRMAARAADRVVIEMAGARLVDRTEADVSREVRERLLAAGHESAAFAIVASGPNSASPHHGASDRLIGPGDPIVLDIGGTLNGYGSDTTRTLWVTGEQERRPDSGFVALYETLERAQVRATEAVAPGVACERIDRVAREIIEGSGFGPNFMHRTGHGIGLEEHEPPWIVAGNAEPLEVGHAFSVEPGIYIDGRHGARIEDIVVCGAAGPDVLNATPRGLMVVRGIG